MKVKTTDLPGIGKKYTMETAEGIIFVVIIHHTGHREIYFMEDEDAEEEIGIIEDIVDLDPDSQNALERVLEKIYFMPRITKIYEVEEEFGVTRWEVETEKGRRSFDIKSRRRDIRPYDNGRIIFHDIDGNRYEITDYRKLDKNSQKRLRSEI
ncbi:MAG: DUF1854 domain-containing protein [Halanaerobiales bacterium]